MAIHILVFGKEDFAPDYDETSPIEYLCREAFESRSVAAQIPAATLKERLPKALRLAEEHERGRGGHRLEDYTERLLERYRGFVALCEEKEKETGEPVKIIVNQ